ncbi:MAG: glycosyl hydrolase family 17 protein [Sedimentisphaerales bacterium]|jgi:exo-beta-1,3-glucanase (GH17 family)
MNTFPKKTRMVACSFLFLFLLAALCWAKEAIPTAAEVSKGLATLASDPSSAAEVKQKLFGISEEGFAKLCEQAKPEERGLLSLLYFSRQTLPNGMTDASLEGNFKDGRVVKDVSYIFDKPEVIQKLSVLEDYSPDDLKNLFVSIAAVWYDTIGGLPYGASRTTWASQRMTTAVENIRKVELAKRSAVLKLMVLQKDITLPSSAVAIFDWSSAPSIKIDLLPPSWTKEDVSALKRLKDSKYEYYRAAAGKVLEQLGEKGGLESFSEKTASGQSDGRMLTGVCYGPFRENQDPESGIFPSRKEIEEDIRLISKTAKALRTYGSGQTPGYIPAICDQIGVDCFLGIWLGKEKDDNRKEIEAGLKIANERHKSVKALIVGSEVLLRKDLSEDELIAYIKEVKDRTKDIPNLRITTAETWKVVLLHPKVAEAVDFLLPHIYSYWDGIPIENGAQYIVDSWRKVSEAFSGKEVIIGETGWPSMGSANGKAKPSEENQAKFFKEFIELARQNGIKYFYFEMFDEMWKEKFEGNVGAHWGIYDSGGSVKPKNESIVPEAVKAGIKRPKFIPAPVEVNAPFIVYDGEGDRSNFYPSGWMGDQGPISLDKSCSVNPHSGKICARISYDPSRGVSQRWSGIYWQFPLNNWGNYPGYKMKGGVSALNFWARGENGGEKAEFKVGGIHDSKFPFRDSFGPKSSGVIELTKEWKQYSIDLRGQDLSSFIGGFCWVTNTSQNRDGCVIYVDDIEIVP